MRRVAISLVGIKLAGIGPEPVDQPAHGMTTALSLDIGLLATCGAALAQTAFPAKPARVVLPFLPDGDEAVGSRPDQFADLVRTERDYWAKVVEDVYWKLE